MASDCASLNPSAWSRWTNFRVSKWWSLAMAGVEEKAREKAFCCWDIGGRRRAVHRCLATADVAVVRLGAACWLCWKPWLANAAEGRMVLAVQERRGRASRARSADGAAMFDAFRDCAVCRWMLSGRSTGVAVSNGDVVKDSAPRSLSVPGKRQITTLREKPIVIAAAARCARTLVLGRSNSR